MYHSFDERIYFAIIFSSSMRVAFCSKFYFLELCPMEGLIKLLFSVCLSVHQQFSIELRNVLLIFFWFFAPWYTIWILKNWQSTFSRKIHLSPNLVRNCPKWHENRVFGFFEKFCDRFPGNDLKWKLVLLLIFHHKSESHIWQNSNSQVMGRNAVDQSNCRIL